MTKGVTNNELGIKILKLACRSIILYSLFFILYSVPVLAQDSAEYELLAPLPGVTVGDSASSTTASTYIPGMVQLIITIAGVLAVIKIIVGGLQYMSTDAIGGKSEGKKHIQNALWGLFLIISAWVILYTLNPKLVKLDLSIEGLRVGAPLETDLGGEPGSPEGIRGPTFGAAWPEDDSVRERLEDIRVFVNRQNCKTVGQGLVGAPEPLCTSVYQLSDSIVSKLQSIMASCGRTCTAYLTGGTEYWLHGNRSTNIASNPTKHKPGGSAVDFSTRSDYAIFNNYIRSQTRGEGASGCAVGAEWYTVETGGSSVIFVNEGSKSNETGEFTNAPDGVAHWHACF